MLTLSPETALSFLAYAFAASATPGPNNIMLTASGANFGFRRSVPHVLGVAFGFGFMMAVVGLGLGAVFQAAPRLQVGLKILGAAYLLWLAWKIGSAETMAEAKGDARPLSALQAAAFQWVNAKAWMMVVGTMSIYAADGALATVLAIVATVIAIGLVTSAFWAGFGVAMRRFLSTPWRLRAFNIAMAVLLVASLVPMLA